MNMPAFVYMGGETTCELPGRKGQFYMLHGKVYWLFIYFYRLTFYSYTQAKAINEKLALHFTKDTFEI